MMFCELSREEYAAFQQHYRYRNFLNSVESATLEEMEGLSVFFVGSKEQGEVVAAAMLVKLPLMKKFHYLYAPRGVLVDYHDVHRLREFSEQLKQYAKKQGAVYIVMDPYVLYKERDMDGNLLPDGFDHSDVVDNLLQCGFQHKGFSVGYGKNMQFVRWMYSMSLQGMDANTIWKNLHQQTRWSINRTLKYQMQVKELSIEEMSLFDDIMKKTGERRHFASRELSFYEHQCKAYGEHLKVLLAYVDVPLYKNSLLKELQQEEMNAANATKELAEHASKKFAKKLKVAKEAIALLNKKIQEAEQLEVEHGSIIPMAASMFMLYGDEVTYLTSGAYEQFRSFYASYAIQWHMIQEVLKLGYKKYNFYGISGEFDEENENYGVYKFKRGFPGQVEELIGDFVLPTRKIWYQIYRILREKNN